MKWVGIVLLVLLVLLSGCFDPSSAPSCTIACATDSDCTDGQTCNAASGTCTSGEDCTVVESCTPGEFVACVDGAARACNATGDGTVDAPCGAPGCNVDAKRCNMCIPDEVRCSPDMTRVLQCAADGSAAMPIESCAANCVDGTQATAAHCRYLEPKWLPDICDMPATEDVFMPNASAAFSSDLDDNCTGGVVPQSPGRAICVVRAKTITIPAGITLTISGQRPIAFVADESLTVNGTLDGGADRSVSGPGGGTQTSGTGPGASAGGGGAGFLNAGAAGGDTATGNGNAGGAALDPITLAFFAGGPRAASGGILDPNGGGGGGAILLATCRGATTLASGSIIDVGGGGGGGQFDQIQGAQIQQSACAAGGGAGGYVVVQGLTGVSMTGSIYANGGGGGAGNTTNDSSGGVGGNGPRSVSTGGTGGISGGSGAPGGRGGFRGTAPAGGGGTTSGANGGGGGGSVGHVHVFTPTGVSPSITSTNMSPAPIQRSTPTR